MKDLARTRFAKSKFSFYQDTSDAGGPWLSADELREEVKAAEELVGLVLKLSAHHAAILPDPDTALPTPSPAQWAERNKAGARVLFAYCSIPEISEADTGGHRHWLSTNTLASCVVTGHTTDVSLSWPLCTKHCMRAVVIVCL